MGLKKVTFFFSFDIFCYVDIFLWCLVGGETFSVLLYLYLIGLQVMMSIFYRYLCLFLVLMLKEKVVMVHSLLLMTQLIRHSSLSMVYLF